VADEPYPTKTIDGEDYWVIECLVPKESDPERGAYIFFAKPLGGVSGIAGLIKGDPGDPAKFIEGPVDFTELAHEDPTTAEWEIVEVSPGQYTLRGSLHAGPPGKDGDTVLNPTDYSQTPSAGQILAVNSTGDAFELVEPRAGALHWPASVTEATAGTTSSHQLAVITVSAGTYRTAWRPQPLAAVTVTGSSSDIAVDIVARLGATNGPVIGRGKSIPGVQTQRVILHPAPDAGTNPADTSYYVAAGAAATIYLMAEKVDGSATYGTANTQFAIKAVAL